MKPSLVLAIIISVFIGSGATYAVMNRQQTTDGTGKDASKTVNSAQDSMAGQNSMAGMNHGDSMSSMSMASMSAELQGKSGNEFDKAFVSLMIEHHQDAIDMAKQVQTNAKHEELKSLVNDIIAAQTKEIEQMRGWQKQWSY